MATATMSRDLDTELEAQIAICGKRFVADRSGALYWPAESTLIVADLHLEKGTSGARNGTFLPPYDTRETLMALAQAIDRYEPARVVALGDSLHDRRAASRIAPECLEVIAIMAEGRHWHWITGNHDPAVPTMLGGEVSAGLTLAGMTLRHEPSAGRITHEIAGHLHPAARLSSHGQAIRRPCFVSNGLRLVLPAFGVYAGGLNVLDAAFEPVFAGDGLKIWMLGQDRVYAVASRRLRTE
ncbi:MAG: ligase-associated DNA damage response endonuclease PdeM [Hyphomicrobiaceae bacterium]|nr:MAG: ligase-associated DNA damage response endonuclease PdeM [Hyphomicrobiaceae bacterium]